ncbi:MAG: hypothetical protein Q9187_004331 [Circinaria calcarea]
MPAQDRTDRVRLPFGQYAVRSSSNSNSSVAQAAATAALQRAGSNSSTRSAVSTGPPTRQASQNSQSSQSSQSTNLRRTASIRHPHGRPSRQDSETGSSGSTAATSATLARTDLYGLGVHGDGQSTSMSRVHEANATAGGTGNTVLHRTNEIRRPRRRHENAPADGDETLNSEYSHRYPQNAITGGVVRRQPSLRDRIRTTFSRNGSAGRRDTRENDSEATGVPRPEPTRSTSTGPRVRWADLPNKRDYRAPERANTTSTSTGPRARWADLPHRRDYQAPERANTTNIGTRDRDPYNSRDRHRNTPPTTTTNPTTYPTRAGSASHLRGRAPNRLNSTGRSPTPTTLLSPRNRSPTSTHVRNTDAVVDRIVQPLASQRSGLLKRRRARREGWRSEAKEFGEWLEWRRLLDVEEDGEGKGTGR